jgi:general secretion pathway protein A
MALEAFLVTQISEGKRSLLIVDEAQNLTPRAVEELRMLSNFQFGKQALLQTFLVGQPEFRDILQHPNMQQLRQRVTATCHIGPLDVEETQGYIEHRLKCAGSTGKPEFGPGTFEAIYKATGGIPRRINSVCDRLLLLGFLGDKELLTLEDVDEVVSELHEEVGGSSGRHASSRTPLEVSSQFGAADSMVDIDLAKLQGIASYGDGFSSQLANLSAEQYGDRLQRLERSMLRLERVNLEILSMLQKFVAAVRK